jgi:hypothetical protein
MCIFMTNWLFFYCHHLEKAFFVVFSKLGMGVFVLFLQIVMVDGVVRLFLNIHNQKMGFSRGKENYFVVCTCCRVEYTSSRY